MAQITPESDFGGALREAAGLPGIDTIVEVGPWNGVGTTRCLADGLESKWASGEGNARLFSYETDREMAGAAQSYWTLAAAEDGRPQPRVLVVHGRLSDGLHMTRQEVEAHPLFHKVVSHYHLHYDNEAGAYKSAPYVAFSLPDRVDMVCLDGGEFSTHGDWLALKGRGPRVVALDDTATIKTWGIAWELDEDPAWRRAFSSDERGGSAIFVHDSIPRRHLLNI